MGRIRRVDVGGMVYRAPKRLLTPFPLTPFPLEYMHRNPVK